MHRLRAALAALLLFALASVALAQDWGEVRAASSPVNLRADRSTDAPVIGQLRPGEMVRVALEQEGWAAVFPVDEDTPSPDSRRALGFVYVELLEVVHQDDADAAPRDESELSPRGQALLGIVEAIEEQEAALRERRAALENELDVRSPDEKSAAIVRTEARLETLRRRFSQTVAGMDLDPLGDSVGTDFEWSDELKDLLAPVIQELKRATVRPRELDRLTRDEARYRERVHALDLALEGAAELQARMQSPTVLQELENFTEQWTSDRDLAASELAFTVQRLQYLHDEHTSIASSLSQIFQIFFKSRGRNLLVALGGLLGSLLFLRWLHAQIRRLSPMHRGERGSGVRIFDLVFVIGEVVVATLVFMGTLYLTGDWVLLTIASIFLFGVAWASKTAIPSFWQQAMLLLNLGPVRECERVVHDGIPWQVGSLGFYSELRNPALEGGVLRLPIHALSDLHSRPFGSAEPWFPTRKGDWVLASGAHGRVVVQTPEVVTLVQLGGSRTSYQASEFMTMAPTVLSTGFRLRSVFGVDYQHQAISTQEIPEGLQAYLQGGLAKLGVADEVSKLTCELGAAGASSLDVEVLLDMKGSAAPRYLELERALQRLCVEACNEHGWVIPFSQVTVHMAEGEPPADTPE